MTTPKPITDDYIRRSLTLLRAAEGEAMDSAKRLRKIHSSLAEEIKKVFGKPTTRKIKTLRVAVDEKLSSFYNEEWPEELKEISTEVITREVSWNENLLENVSGEKLISPRLSSVQSSAAKKKYQGKTFDVWVDRSFPAEKRRINNALRQGFDEGESIAQITQRIKQITGRAENDVRTITRSFFMHNATEAKESVFLKNPKLIEAKIWTSTLDSRTTPLICGVRDQKWYNLSDEPIGHNLPWDAGPGRIHWNCRSTSVPKVRGIPSTSSRPSVGAGENYERGDSITRTGRVRKLSKRATENGIYKVDQKTTRTRYEGWLRGQSRKNIDYVSDVLGSKQKAIDFRDGNITLAQLGLESPVARPINKAKI